MDSFELNRYDPPLEKMKAFKEKAYQEMDQKMLIFMAIYTVLTIVLSAISKGEGDNNEINVAIGLGIGLFNLAFYVSLNLLPKRNIKRYLTSLVLVIFTISFIYFSKGAIYIHVSLIISLIVLSLYGNWRLLLPYAIIMLLYYILAIYQIKAGNNWEQYFMRGDFTNQGNFIIVISSIGFITFMLMIFLSRYIDQLRHNEGLIFLYLQDQLNVEHNVNLVNQIAGGNLESKYALKDNDKIGNALFEMRENLKLAAQQNQKKQWISDGIAHMGDILLASGDVSEICHNVLREIIRYIGLEHGGIFIVNIADSENPYLELRSFFAFDQPDFIERKIHFGEGLVGEVAARKTSILLRDLPNTYESISSGLGSALPKNIFITPLMVKDDVMGVLELSSLRDIQEHELELVEKVSSNIALSILSANAATQTARLLKESQVYNEHMKAQEEEMRSSMEALRQTQDELSRQVEARASVQSELSTRMNVVDRMAIVAEIDLEGQLIYINKQFSRITGYTEEECLGKNYDILRHPDTPEVIFKEIWITINRKEVYVGSFKSVTSNGDVIWFECAIAPVLDHENQPSKFLCIGFDITELKQKEQDIQSLLSAAKARNEVLNLKEENMQRNLEALEIAEEELSEQIQMSIRRQEFYDLVLTFVKGIIYRSILEDEWKLEFLSTGTYELTGYDHTDFLGDRIRTFNSIIHPDDLPLIVTSVNRNPTIIEESSTHQVKGFKIQYRIIREDGEIRWVEERGKKYYDHYLKKDILTGFIYDITESLHNQERKK
ncbi:MAG: PAS domain-containing protein [Flammeovirgaceae bacterium]